MLLAMAWMVMAAVMYLLRPSSMRGQGDAKPQGKAKPLSGMYRTRHLYCFVRECTVATTFSHLIDQELSFFIYVPSFRVMLVPVPL